MMPGSVMTKESVNPKREKEQAQAVTVAIYGSAVTFAIAAFAGIVADSITLLLDAATILVIFAVALMAQSSVRKVHRLRTASIISGIRNTSR